MNYTFYLQCFTKYGECVYLHIDDQKIAMEYVAHGTWRMAYEWAERRCSRYGYSVEDGAGGVWSDIYGTHRVLCEVDGANEVLVYDEFGMGHIGEVFGRLPFYSLYYPHAVVPTTDVLSEGGLLFQAFVPCVGPAQGVGLLGSVSRLGEWHEQLLLPLSYQGACVWQLYLADAASLQGAEYKVVIYDKQSGEVQEWEEGLNRTIPSVGNAAVVSLFPRRTYSWRGAGVAVPLFSLRSEQSWGVGDFEDLKGLVLWGVNSGQKLIQLLPINDTTQGGGALDSYPYSAISVYALHPMYIRPDRIVGSGSAAVIDGYAGEREVLNAKEQVDYEGVMQLKMRCLRDLFKCCGQETLQSAGYKEFCSANQYWLLPYSVFCVLRDAHGSAEFGDWSELNVYDAAAVQAYAQQHEQEVSWHHYLQYHASCQLLQARELAHHNGVMLKGDLPIGISGRSVDAWMHAPLFHLDMQAGAPPDPFSAIGQNWGFPTYNWEVMRSDGYAWWRARFKYMQQYFDAMRIDHILGFFRMWSIPQGAIWGLLGQFSPALPLSEQELKDYGIELDLERYLKPYITAGRLVEEFEDGAPGVAERFLQQRGDWNYEFLPAFATQQQMQNYLAGAGAGIYSADEQMRLMRLYTEVLLIADTERSGYYHPRIDLHKSFSFKSLDVNLKQAFQRLHDDFYYARHETFWRESALSKLPSLLHSTEMLMCGEDLGMLPACVAPVMAQLQLLTLEIERMPKQMGYLFVDAQTTPYLSVFSTGTHDMSTLRGWWCEDRTLTEQYYKMVLHGEGKAPKELTPSVAEAIVEHALKSHSMLVIVPLQDYLAMDGVGGSMADAGERINDPANANQVWCYRMPISLEELNGHLFFDEQLRKMVTESGR